MTNKIPPLVSIAVPTYNRANSFLKESLASAINQTYQNIEVIVSDNCSTDNTELVVKSFNDSRIRYFRQKENIGAINNGNYCLDQAKGVYFTLLHDDNLIENDFIEICLKSVGYSEDIGVIRAGTRWIDEEGNVLREYPNMAKGLSTDAYFRAYFSGQTASFRYFSYPLNPRQAYEVYREGYSGSLLGNFFNKYRIKFAFMKGSREMGSLEI